MTGVFGAVAATYDEVRPGYPAALAASVVDHHGGAPARIVEVGAGTGKGTEVLHRIGAPLTCIEPDPGMAAVLRTRFPDVTVHAGRFEDWAPPPGGVPLLACAMAWHWLDPARRNRLAHDALAPSGTLAVFAHHYGYADPAHGEALLAAICRLDSSVTERPEGWFRDDIAGSGLFVDVTATTWARGLVLPRERYLRLMRTFGPYRERPPELRAAALRAVGAVLDDLGGAVTMDLRTTLVLARRPARSATG